MQGHGLRMGTAELARQLAPPQRAAAGECVGRVWRMDCMAARFQAEGETKLAMHAPCWQQRWGTPGISSTRHPTAAQSRSGLHLCLPKVQSRSCAPVVCSLKRGCMDMKLGRRGSSWMKTVVPPTPKKLVCRAECVSCFPRYEGSTCNRRGVSIAADQAMLLNEVHEHTAPPANPPARCTSQQWSRTEQHARKAQSNF